MEFVDIYLQDLRGDFDEERPVGRVVAVFIDVATYDGRCHPAVGAKLNQILAQNRNKNDCV